MRKHGWRTPEWKLIVALEPDFHFKPPVELYRLTDDPEELHNLADELPDVVAFLRERMEALDRASAARHDPVAGPDPRPSVTGTASAGVGPFSFIAAGLRHAAHRRSRCAAQRLQAGDGDQ